MQPGNAYLPLLHARSAYRVAVDGDHGMQFDPVGPRGIAYAAEPSVEADVAGERLTPASSRLNPLTVPQSTAFQEGAGILSTEHQREASHAWVGQQAAG